MPELEIVSITVTPCGRHGAVMLRDGHGTALRIALDVPTGRALALELEGHTTSHARTADLLHAALDACGARVEAVRLHHRDGTLAACLEVDHAPGCSLVPVDPANALLIAARLHIPLLLVDAPIGDSRVAIPSAFHTALAGLDLSGLDGDEAA